MKPTDQIELQLTDADKARYEKRIEEIDLNVESDRLEELQELAKEVFDPLEDQWQAEITQRRMNDAAIWELYWPTEMHP